MQVLRCFLCLEVHSLSCLKTQGWHGNVTHVNKYVPHLVLYAWSHNGGYKEYFVRGGVLEDGFIPTESAQRYV